MPGRSLQHFADGGAENTVGGLLVKTRHRLGLKWEGVNVGFDPLATSGPWSFNSSHNSTRTTTQAQLIFRQLWIKTGPNLWLQLWRRHTHLSVDVTLTSVSTSHSPQCRRHTRLSVDVTLASVSTSHSPLCRRHTHLCVDVTLTSVSTSHSPLCLRHTHLCVYVTLTSVSTSHSLLCLRHTHLCVYVTLTFVSTSHSLLCLRHTHLCVYVTLVHDHQGRVVVAGAAQLGRHDDSIDHVRRTQAFNDGEAVMLVTLHCAVLHGRRWTWTRRFWEMRKRIEAISSGAIGCCGFEPRVSDMMWFGDYGCIK